MASPTCRTDSDSAVVPQKELHDRERSWHGTASSRTPHSSSPSCTPPSYSTLSEKPRERPALQSFATYMPNPCADPWTTGNSLPLPGIRRPFAHMLAKLEHL